MFPTCRRLFWIRAGTIDILVNGLVAHIPSWWYRRIGKLSMTWPPFEACVLAALSIIAGGGKWVEIAIAADCLYQHLLLTAEKKFWRCVESGEPPRLFGAEPPRPRIEAVRVVDMSSSNAWAEVAGVYCQTRDAFLQHENAKAELKGLMPEDAKEAAGHGVRAKRSKSGAISFDVLEVEAGHAALK